jgi:hypothetical protein
MKVPFLITGLLLLIVASILMMRTSVMGFATSSSSSSSQGFEDMKKKAEGFASHLLEQSAGTGKSYEPIGAFDGVKLVPSNGVSQYRNTLPNEPLMGPAFEVGPDSLFMFKNNQCKPECCGASFACDGGCVCSTPEQRRLINTRGGNRTVEETI